MTTFTLDPLPKIITFDCYGTIVQWHEVLLREISKTLEKQSDSVTAPAVLESYSAHSRRLTAEQPYRPYKDILRIGFAAAFADHGISPSAAEIEGIASSVKTMGPHPDARDALHRLRKRYKLAILTNSDDDLIAPTVARIGVPFNYVITAQQAQAYKPSPRLFDHAYRTMGVMPHETVHVAMGMYTDMKARHELGLRGIWVNRRKEAANPDWMPYAEVPDLKRAAALLLPSE